MAQNVVIAGATYNDVPSVNLITSSGSTANFVDTSDANAIANDILQGKTAYVDGEKIVGTGSGGGIDTKIFKFYDYKGNILHEYTPEEVLELQELPSLPEDDEYVFPTEWMITLQELYTIAQDTYYLSTGYDIGANYNTKEEADYFFLDIKEDTLKSVVIYYSTDNTSFNGTATIDWGDGTSSNLNTKAKQDTIEHTYTSIGKYVGKIYNNNSYFRLGATWTTSDYYTPFCGDNFTNTADHPNQSRNYRNVIGLIIQPSIKVAHVCDYKLVNQKFILVCGGTKNQPANMDFTFTANYGKAIRPFITIGYINEHSFYGQYVNLLVNNLPKGDTRYVVNLKKAPLYYNYYAPSWELSQKIPEEFYFPWFVTKTNAIPILSPYIIHYSNIRQFVVTFNMESNVYYFENNTQVPTLPYAPGTGGDAIFYVPQNLYNEWINATNWSAIADQIYPLEV